MFCTQLMSCPEAILSKISLSVIGCPFSTLAVFNFSTSFRTFLSRRGMGGLRHRRPLWSWRYARKIDGKYLPIGVVCTIPAAVSTRCESLFGGGAMSSPCNASSTVQPSIFDLSAVNCMHCYRLKPTLNGASISSEYQIQRHLLSPKGKLWGIPRSSRPSLLNGATPCKVHLSDKQQSLEFRECFLLVPMSRLRQGSHRAW